MTKVTAMLTDSEWYNKL